jgi:nucleoid-associated protein YgaU
MTSDAKIGLLLGLVFIFIIAFVINGFGLPRFHSAVDNNEPAVVVQGDPLGWQRNTEGVFQTPEEDRQVSNVASENTDNSGYRTPWSDDYSVAQGNRVDETADLLSANRATEPYSDYPPVVENVNNNAQDSAAAEDNQDQSGIRDTRQFAFNNSGQSDISITQLSTNTQEQQRTFPSGRQGFPFLGGMNRSNNPFGQRPGQMPQQQVPQGIQQQNQQTSPQTPPVQTINTVRETPLAQSKQTKTYVIQEGDSNLAKIAKKFYGEEEGNRLVNINRIFEANKSVLKSPDKIFVGQTIVIPQPAAPVADSAKPANVPNGGMFQTVPSIGGSSKQNTTKIPDTKNWYVVKEDDSLWKIADEQLGKATRYEEIIKLNTDILTSGNKLKPGMKLRLPAQ